MTGKQKAGIVLLTAGAAYLVWRLQVANREGGPVTLALFPGAPSNVGTDGTGDTNPIAMMFARIGEAFKAPGNAPAVPYNSAKIGTAADPLAPPDMLTLTAQPETDPALAALGYAPNLGDPNFSAWNFLATTPPDLAWGVNIPGTDPIYA